MASSSPWSTWAAWAALGAATVGGCGGGSGASYQGSTGHDAGGSNDAGSGSSSGSTGEGGGSGSDSSVSDDGTTSSPVDASLDIAFPDSFYGPEASVPDAGDDGADDTGAGCAPEGDVCQGNVAYDCNGGKLTVTDCTALTPAQTCSSGYGCVVCQPGTGTCSGSTGTACNSAGTGTVTNVCDPLLGLTCGATSGECVGDCSALGSSYIGCEYYAVTMLNHLLDQGTFYFSVSLSNTSTKTASVNIQGGALTSAMTVSIPAGQLSEVKLPWVKALSCGSGTCNGSRITQPTPPGTTLAGNGAYHIKSTEPLTAYEFNARDYVIGSEYSYTNDASLLIPVNAMTGAYHVASWPTFGTWPGLMTVIATQANTTVTVAATNAIQPLGALGASGGKVTMNAGDVLQIMTALNAGGATSYGTDPSGTSISANNPVEVFGGHSCVYINTSTGYCDHIEQIAFPDETLRGDYIVTVPYNQNATPQHWVKLVGTTANTHVSFDPPTVSGAVTLNAGSAVLMQGVTQNFRVHSTDNPPQPFVVAQYMIGQNNFGSGCVDVTPPAGQTCGDPSMSLAVATAQFRSSYQFSAPQSYYQNWVNVIAPTAATVTVDGVTVTGYSAIGTSGYGVAHVSLCGNQTAGCNPVHQATSTSAFGIEVYGYGSYTSYMYPGGLNLARQ